MTRTDAIIIGGGQAGLAMSRCLADQAIDHVVLERGRVAERWRSERWDSLRLLTPNWQSRLPGFRYTGPDPDGFMTVPELVGFLEIYAASVRAPIVTDCTVIAVEPAGRGYRVETTRGEWRAPNVIVATGYNDVPIVPAFASALPADILQVTPSRYRNPSELPDGGVLVVGAAATGIQLAEEIHASGRPVTVSIGRHLRLPRRYRDRDILWWMDAMGIFDETVEQVFDVGISRSQPSLQLVGRPDNLSLDLTMLQARGVRVVGRTAAVEGARVWFEDDVVATTVASDAKLAVLLGRIDAYIADAKLDGIVGPAEPFRPCWPSALAPTPSVLDLRAEGIRSVLWATGFRRHYPWLRVPVLDGLGDIRHDGGVTPAPGLYVLGMQFQRRRKSAFLDGVGDDARELTTHILRRGSDPYGARSRRPGAREARTRGDSEDRVYTL